MKTVALSGLELAINSYLQLDPDTIQRMAELSDKVICVEITDWRLTLYILPNHNGLNLMGEYEGDVDTTMKADLCSFVNIAKAKGDTNSLFKNNLHIEGDAHTGEQLRDILSAIDIDWEEHLSRITGDVVAHNVFNMLSSVGDLARRTRQRLCENMSEYVREEKQWAPGQNEVEDFYQDIAELRDAVERLEAKMNYLFPNEETA